jgi:4-diphosphocytidyl-2-C-methyl-D-erythritol kinase
MSAAEPVAVLVAPAKLTTSLRVVGVRPDGYHLIDAEMVSVSLADTVSITPLRREAGETAITVGGPFGDGVPTDRDNLIWKALVLCGRGARVHVDKQIPHGGGLGGGSADAAAVLRWAEFDDAVAAGALGADIPFCMHGGRARVTGIGEVVRPLAHQDATYTIVVPPFAVSTPLVYRAWDHLSGPLGDNGNDLEPAAIHVEPRLYDWKLGIAAHSGLVPKLAGSGATWFLDGDHSYLATALPDALVAVVRALPPT